MLAFWKSRIWEGQGNFGSGPHTASESESRCNKAYSAHYDGIGLEAEKIVEEPLYIGKA